MSLREELETALDEYVGFPPDEVPRWVDWDIALGELLTVIDKYKKEDIKLERQAFGEFLKKRENAYTTGGWKPVVFGDEIEALLRGERPEAVG